MEKEIRHLTVSYRYHNSSKVPNLVICGKWLKDLGFDISDKVSIQCSENQLIISKEKRVAD